MILLIVYKCLLYAENIVFYKDIDLEVNPNDIETVQNDFIRTIEWCQINELTINCKNTKAQFLYTK